MSNHEGDHDPSPADLNKIVIGIAAKVSRFHGRQRMDVLKAELENIDPEWKPAVEALVIEGLQTGIQAGKLEMRAEAAKTVKKWLLRATPVLVILLVIFALPRIIGIVRGSSVVVPESHFVGEHGKNKKLIVFVHGVLGDMDNTWVNPTTHASWPEMIRNDPSFLDFDVFVYGYSSPPFTEASRIDEIAQRFGQQLKDWKMFKNYQEIDFVTHSMGGIITKRMLNTLNTPSQFDLLQHVHCVIYMAVPSNGAEMAALASWISLNPQFRNMNAASAASFLASVEDDWAALLLARSSKFPFPKTFSAYEKLPIHGVMVVPELYTSKLSDGPIMAFDYTHATIVKPKSPTSDVYEWVAARLEQSSEGVDSSRATKLDMIETKLTPFGFVLRTKANRYPAVIVDGQLY